MVPGAAFTGRVPLGKAKKRIGIELVADIHLAPPVTLKAQELSTVDIDFNAKIITVIPPTKVSMVHGNAGVAITLRHK